MSARKPAALAAAERELRAADKAWDAIDRKCSDQRSALEAKARLEIIDAMAALEQERSLARAARREAQARVDAATVEATLAAGGDGTYKIGARMVEWVRPSQAGRWSGKRESRRVGVVDVWTPESPRGTKRYWTPSVGDLYIRVLKKDGSPSENFERLATWNDRWLPEGETPKPKERS